MYEFYILQLIIIAKWLTASASKKAHATALASFSRATREGLACAFYLVGELYRIS